MRKLILLAISGLVLLGVMGLEAQSAFAKDPEEDCAGQPVGVQGFHFGTVNPVGGETSVVYGGGALCGTDIEKQGIGQGWDVKGAYKEGYILTPSSAAGGAKVHCANPYGQQGHEVYCEGSDYPEGTYFGSSGVNVQQCLATGGAYGLGERCNIHLATMSYLHVGKAAWPGANDQCDQAGRIVVQCLQSADDLGLGIGNITVEPCWLNSWCKNAVKTIPNLDPAQNRYVMHIYPIDSLGDGPVYYTEIGEPEYNHQGQDPDPRDFQLCEFANPSGDRQCGTDPANWVQKNPPAGSYACSPPAGEAIRAIGVGSLEGAIGDRCYPGNWT